MVKDRTKFVSHSPLNDKTLEEETNDAIESLGDVEIVDIDFLISNGWAYVKIWYRPNSGSVGKESPNLGFAPVSKFTPETLKDPSIRKGGG